MNQSATRSNVKRYKISEFNAQTVGQTVIVQARVHSSRVAGILI
jgi:hypothetical protein